MKAEAESSEGTLRCKGSPTGECYINNEFGGDIIGRWMSLTLKPSVLGAFDLQGSNSQYIEESVVGDTYQCKEISDASMSGNNVSSSLFQVAYTQTTRKYCLIDGTVETLDDSINDLDPEETTIYGPWFWNFTKVE